MAATRSSARLALKANAMQTSEETISSPANSSNGKRKNNNAALKAPAFKKSKTQTGAGSTTVGSTANPQTTRAPSDTNADAPVPAVLSFDFNEAMRHLITVDPRFQDLFDRMPCRPFEQLEQVHPFRALSISILGQQISWKAARSITHKFIRLYSPSIPEEVTDESRAAAMQVFPTPEQVSKTEVSLLRTAGLSERKAQYIQDLAARFADGRLSTDKLLNASDEELAEMLIEVKGIGRWTGDSTESIPLSQTYRALVC
ncbi:hypothetical protein CC2G_008801 [Coprinopsis cinerea AmutBmut pab1-1]|nr:hypothetical protein CC2G_008801 [Coprinopsis cinerea AmutBmut pab1-1]